MSLPTFVVICNYSGKVTITKPQIHISNDNSLFRTLVFNFKLPSDFIGCFYFAYGEHNLLGIYEKIVQFPSAFRYVSLANAVISVDDNNNTILHKGRYGDDVKLLSSEILKSVEDGKDIYVLDKSLIKYKPILQMLGYDVEDITTVEGEKIYRFYKA